MKPFVRVNSQLLSPESYYYSEKEGLILITDLSVLPPEINHVSVVFENYSPYGGASLGLKFVCDSQTELMLTRAQGMELGYYWKKY